MKISGENLIFIVSQPRSGSTLLQALLSNNSDVSTSSEPWVAIPFLMLREHESINEATYGAMHAIDRYLNTLPSGNEVWDDTIRNAILNLYSPKFDGSFKYMLDKTPRYYEVLPELKHYFPNSKIIILKRNPLAVLNSIIDTWFSADNAKVSNLISVSRDLLVAPRLIDEFSKNHADDNNVIVTNYDDIVSNPKNEIERLYKFLDIKFNSKYLNFNENKKYQGELGDPKIQSTKGLIHSDSSSNWESKLSDRYWSGFFEGYIEYLGEDILNQYPNINQGRGKKTLMFRYYLFKLTFVTSPFRVLTSQFIKSRTIFRKWLNE